MVEGSGSIQHSKLKADNEVSGPYDFCRPLLDELPEFGTRLIEVLRQPLEGQPREVSISRASGTITFPANFMLIAAQNPCPCGYYGDNSQTCTCSNSMITRYQKRISGPLMDRIDIHVEVPRVPFEKLSARHRGELSEVVRGRVEAARERQAQRFAEMPLFCNAEMGPSEVKSICTLDSTGMQSGRPLCPCLGRALCAR